jgi:hypothetical protein
MKFEYHGLVKEHDKSVALFVTAEAHKSIDEMRII